MKYDAKAAAVLLAKAKEGGGLLTNWESCSKEDVNGQSIAFKVTDICPMSVGRLQPGVHGGDIFLCSVVPVRIKSLNFTRI